MFCLKKNVMANTLNEALCFECLLEVNFIPDLKWNSCKQSISKDVGKMLQKIPDAFYHAI